MYNGGHAYFGSILKTFQQPSSYFALQNDFWTLVGLDTAYNQSFGGHEGVLDDEQATWLRKIVAAAEDRKIVLFTHHQPLTLLDNNSGGNLFEKLKEFLDARKIFA